MADLLDVRGIGPALEKQMRALGFGSPRAVAEAHPRDLCVLSGVQLARARMLIAAAEEVLRAAGEPLDADPVEATPDDLIPSADPSVDLEVLKEIKQGNEVTPEVKPAKKKGKSDKKKKKKKLSAKSAKESAEAKMTKAGKAVSARGASKDKKKKKKAAKKT